MNTLQEIIRKGDIYKTLGAFFHTKEWKEVGPFKDSLSDLKYLSSCLPLFYFFFLAEISFCKR